MALDLFVSGGKRNRKGETESERGRAINITQAAERRAKEALKGVGTQTERGRHGGIFMGEKRQQVRTLLQSLDAFCSCASKEGERRRAQEGGATEKNKKPWRFAAVCGSDEVTSSHPETYFCRGEEERREEIQYIIRKAEGKLRQLKQHSRHLQNAGWFLDTDRTEVSRQLKNIYIYIYYNRISRNQQNQMSNNAQFRPLLLGEYKLLVGKTTGGANQSPQSGKPRGKLGRNMAFMMVSSTNVGNIKASSSAHTELLFLSATIFCLMSHASFTS